MFVVKRVTRLVSYNLAFNPKSTVNEPCNSDWIFKISLKIDFLITVKWGTYARLYTVLKFYDSVVQFNQNFKKTLSWVDWESIHSKY